MKDKSRRCGLNFDESFYGSVTVGERGQVVIPAEARAALGINAGDKILVMHHPIHQGIVLFKIEAVRDFLNEMAAGLDQLETRASQAVEDAE
ncbi:MAG: AbrB/MazE/SpoVT family DNA-binding domain-containing protein [Fimbriimonadaceae bacterium]